MANLRTLPFLFLCSIILLIPVSLTALVFTIHFIYAQTPTTIQGADTGALRFVPQDAIIVTKSPEGFTSSDLGMGQGGILATVTAVAGLGTAIYTKIFASKENKETRGVVKEVAQHNVDNAIAIKATNENVFETMPNKGNDITNKPDIKLVKLEENKQKALETVKKA